MPTSCQSKLLSLAFLPLFINDLYYRDLEKKREDYLEWPEYFMAVAFLSAMRSKDPCTQVGACITDSNNRIVGVGYNGMPIGCSDEILPWGKTSSKPLENKYMYGRSLK
jgi:dCMP deaminase